MANAEVGQRQPLPHRHADAVKKESFLLENNLMAHFDLDDLVLRNWVNQKEKGWNR